TVTTCCFFFTSRRRHTRSYGDWSSDVCSSDLRSWPAALQSLRSATVAAERARLHARVEFHTWLQWATQTQRAAAQAAARAAGMKIGRASCRERVESSGDEGRGEERQWAGKVDV